MDQELDTRVIVSIPFYRCQRFIRRAVDSILGQTHRNLVLVVANDGDPQPPWPLLRDIRDPRLIRFDLQANHGRYFTDAVVLGATDAPYFVVQDADDWSAPGRIAALLGRLRADHADAASSSFYDVGQSNGAASQRRRDIRPERRALPLGEQFRHRMWHCGLFRVAALRSIGGYYAGFRIGYDSLLMNLLLMTWRVTYIDEPLYHRTIRPDSLVHSRATGFRSAQRRETARELRLLYATAYRWYRQYLDGALHADELRARVRQLCESQVSLADRAALSAETQRLRALLDRRQVEAGVARQ